MTRTYPSNHSRAASLGHDEELRPLGEGNRHDAPPPQRPAGPSRRKTVANHRGEEAVPPPWRFEQHFRRHAFGPRPTLACRRIEEALDEIGKVAAADPGLAAEAAVTLLERLSPALELVDATSGAIGRALDHATHELAHLVGTAPVATRIRSAWLERLWLAYRLDELSFIESLGDHWGDLCASPALASDWADRLLGDAMLAWSAGADRDPWFRGATPCLSALFAAGRDDELLDLVALEPNGDWVDREWGVWALVRKGRKAEAIRLAEACLRESVDPVPIARACEAILLSSGMVDVAYARWAFVANRVGDRAAIADAVERKYPHKSKGEILADLDARGADGIAGAATDPRGATPPVASRAPRDRSKRARRHR